MSRYYYAPINPGFDRLGAGIGQGIQSAASAFTQTRERADQKQRQQKQDERAEALFDLELDRQGVERHPDAPTASWQPDPIFEGLQERTLLPTAPNEGGPGLRVQPAREGAGLGLQAADGAPAWMQEGAARMPRMGADAFRVEEPDARYRHVTGDLYENQERTPEARALAGEERKRSAAEAERAELEEMLFGALSTSRPDLSPEQARTMARVASVDDELLDALRPPEPKRWYPTTEEEALRFEEESARRTAPYRRSGRGSDDDERLTPNQALAQARELSKVYDPEGRFIGYSRTEAQIVEFADQLRSGGPIQDPAEDPRIEGAPIPGAGRGQPQFRFPANRAQGPNRRPGTRRPAGGADAIEDAAYEGMRRGPEGDIELGPQGPAPAAAAPSASDYDREVFDTAVRLGGTPAEAEKILQEEGADAATLQRFRQYQAARDRSRR